MEKNLNKLPLVMALALAVSACGGGSSSSNDAPTNNQDPVVDTTPDPDPDTTPDPDPDTTPDPDPDTTPDPDPDPDPDTTPDPEPSDAISVSGDFILQAEEYIASDGDGQIETGTADSGTIINWFNAGDSVDFKINIDEGGLYEVTYRAASPSADAYAELFVTNQAGDGLVSAGMTKIATGDWGTYQDIVGSQQFNIWRAGEHTIRLVGAGTTDFQFNTNYLSFRRVDDVNTTLDTDQDGVPDAQDLCADSPSTDVDNDGCTEAQKDADNDGIQDSIDQCNNTAAGAIVNIEGCAYTGGAIDVDKANTHYPSFVTFGNTTPAGKRWEKVDSLSDEFDVWDSNKWIKTFWNYGDTPVNMMDKNAGVTNGNLWIQATLDDTSADQWFETARVRSRATIKFPMYTESRIKAAYISAYNTFWLNKGDANNRDEIDIIENNAKPSCGCQPDYPWQMNSQYFIVEDGVTERHHGNSDNRTDLSADNVLNGVPWNEAYHVFGAWWKDANTVQFYLNGEPVNSVTTTKDFTIEQHLIWDLWTQDSTWVGGLPQKEELLNNDNNTMKIDWVRTWQLVDNP